MSYQVCLQWIASADLKENIFVLKQQLSEWKTSRRITKDQRNEEHQLKCELRIEFVL